VTAGMPVMGHIGLTPQSVHALGGFAVQGRTAAAARRLLDDALALEEAGAFAVVLELVPREVAALLTRRLTIPTIGIGSGPECDGQVLVFHDMVGLDDGHGPRHARRYAEIGAEIRRATAAYVADVAARRFPAAEESHSLPPEEREAVLGALGEPPAGEGR
jgi:3-methyl-2-oxobutanoate hydroxymethyltransferase